MQLYFIFLAFIVFLMISGYLTSFLFTRTTAGLFYRILVAPGIIVHELSHAVACIFVGAKIVSIDVFNPRGGEVQHTQSNVPILGNILISLAPMLVGSLVLFYFSSILNFIQIETVNLGFREIVFNGLSAFYNSINLLSWQFWLMIYIVFNITATMAPSKQDVKNVFWDLIALGIIFFLIFNVLKISFDYAPIISFMSVTFGYVVLILILTLGLYLFKRLIQ